MADNKKPQQLDPNLANPNPDAPPDPRTGAVTNPNVHKVEGITPVLVGASPLVKKGPANVIEEEAQRQQRLDAPMKARAKPNGEGPKQLYQVAFGSLKLGDADAPYEATVGQVVELTEDDARHLLEVGAITPYRPPPDGHLPPADAKTGSETKP